MPDIDLATSTGPLRAYLAQPEGDGPFPGVVIVHDVGGLSDDIRRIADRLAQAGFLAVAPDLFHRRGAVRCVAAMMRSLSTGTGPPVDDVVQARDVLVADPRCTGRVGVVGFCMGGGLSLVLAPTGAFDAAAPNYPNWPRDRAALAASCPVVASYGAKDPSLRDAAPALRDILTAGGVEHDVVEYPDAGHSFMNDWRDAPWRLRIFEHLPGFAYSHADAEHAWSRITAFFDRHLSDR